MNGLDAICFKQIAVRTSVDIRRAPCYQSDVYLKQEVAAIARVSQVATSVLAQYSTVRHSSCDSSDATHSGSVATIVRALSPQVAQLTEIPTLSRFKDIDLYPANFGRSITVCMTRM